MQIKAQGALATILIFRDMERTSEERSAAKVLLEC